MGAIDARISRCPNSCSRSRSRGDESSEPDNESSDEERSVATAADPSVAGHLLDADLSSQFRAATADNIDGLVSAAMEKKDIEPLFDAPPNYVSREDRAKYMSPREAFLTEAAEKAGHWEVGGQMWRSWSSQLRGDYDLQRRYKQVGKARDKQREFRDSWVSCCVFCVCFGLGVDFFILTIVHSPKGGNSQLSKQKKQNTHHIRSNHETTQNR